MLGGGQSAADVTTTSSRAGKFQALFYHKIYETEVPFAPDTTRWTTLLFEKVELPRGS